MWERRKAKVEEMGKGQAKVDPPDDDGVGSCHECHQPCPRKAQPVPESQWAEAAKYRSSWRSLGILANNLHLALSFSLSLSLSILSRPRRLAPNKTGGNIFSPKSITERASMLRGGGGHSDGRAQRQKDTAMTLLCIVSTSSTQTRRPG
jgi:hypothetical protein